MVSSYSGVCNVLMKANVSHTLSIKCLIPSINRVSLVIKSGIYAEILTSNDKLLLCYACWADHLMLNASQDTFFKPDMFVLQMKLDNLRCLCGGDGVILREHLNAKLCKQGAHWYNPSAALGLFFPFSDQTSHSVDLFPNHQIIDLGVDTLKHVDRGMMSEQW